MTRTGGFHDFLFSEQRHKQAEELLDTSPLLAFPRGSRVLRTMHTCLAPSAGGGERDAQDRPPVVGEPGGDREGVG
ncbi:hypothetical protein ACFYRD_40685 [Streptomyces hirsutus]|uniref:hypothetical protein n=1 Tax=Streptomyces hirsutus TaxID=35620 RepID=UPI003690E728